MKLRLCCLAAALCCVSSGCELVQLATCNLSYEAWLCKEHTAACIRNRQLAEQAWREAPCANGGQTFSEHYVRGFKDGYAAFLDSNGCLTCPALPPKHYWSARYQTPQGHHAINEWFLGYQQGAEAARASGRRELMTIPVCGPHALPPAPPPPGEPIPEAASFSDRPPQPQAASTFPVAAPPQPQPPDGRSN